MSSIEHTTIYDEYQMLEDRFKALELKLWAAVDRAEKAEARHAALVEAVKEIGDLAKNHLPDRYTPSSLWSEERCRKIATMAYNALAAQEASE